MNGYLVVLGSLSLLGASAHAVLGERFLIGPLNPVSLPTSFLGDGDITKRYLRWFWHVGSFALGASSVALIAFGARYGSPESLLLVRSIAVGFMGMFAAFLVVAVPRPALFIRVPQGLALGIGGLAIWVVA